MRAVLSAKALNGMEGNSEFRPSLDPVVELLCMLSPLQIIYALKIQTKCFQIFNKLVNPRGVGSHDVIQKMTMEKLALCRNTT